METLQTFYFFFPHCPRLQYHIVQKVMPTTCVCTVTNYTLFVMIEYITHTIYIMLDVYRCHSNTHRLEHEHVYIRTCMCRAGSSFVVLQYYSDIRTHLLVFKRSNQTWEFTIVHYS